MTIPDYSRAPCFIAIAAAALVALSTIEGAKAQSTPLPEMALGPEDAPITIVEYASGSCLGCANFHVEVFPLLKQHYIDTGKVRFIFRDYPFDNEAAAVSMLARCHGPDRYFDFMALAFKRFASDAFRNRYRKSPPVAWIKAIALEAGLDDEAVTRCLMDEELIESINVARKFAFDMGITTVPAIFVNGSRVPIPQGRRLRFADIEKAIRNAR